MVTPLAPLTWLESSGSSEMGCEDPCHPCLLASYFSPSPQSAYASSPCTASSPITSCSSAILRGTKNLIPRRISVVDTMFHPITNIAATNCFTNCTPPPPP
uniref:Uncharacterized protein n=1 Tax=Nelumbo nucifera TaxID=4432 RepID=A0A822XXE2_NELNU|nr:TPA_asm: hypothetical protein HUJ06_027752 [Nelumbo nucifera]